jgi:hypothetical protein
MLKLIAVNFFLLSSYVTTYSLGATGEPALQAYGDYPSVCATRPDVIIRDFYTLEDTGRLDQGECMEVITNTQHPNSTIRAQYVTVKGGKSGRLRLVSKQFVVYSEGNAPSPAPAYGNSQSSVCATRPDVIIRDFYTLEDTGRLDQGECMKTINVQHSNPAVRAEYIAVEGGRSGKLRLVSKKFVVYSY